MSYFTSFESGSSETVRKKFGTFVFGDFYEFFLKFRLSRIMLRASTTTESKMASDDTKKEELNKLLSRVGQKDSRLPKFLFIRLCC